ncbi:Hypp1115 [Branchiostoma lanceolatum]|uniref:Hypp1115 protein n=1 Tax=Branchiostoma lanceolatum TaxID=7740 RepID=A0A8K0EM32_BRALA|nr:Hypp1115 [Branchiostoma lanceolatum]
MRKRRQTRYTVGGASSRPPRCNPAEFRLERNPVPIPPKKRERDLCWPHSEFNARLDDVTQCASAGRRATLWEEPAPDLPCAILRNSAWSAIPYRFHPRRERLVLATFRV